MNITIQMSDDESPRQQRERGLRMAKEEAVRRAFKEEITTMSVLAGSREVFAWTQQYAEGFVVECVVRRERWDAVGGKGTLPSYSADYDVAVVRSPGAEDKTFAVSVSLERPTFRPRDALVMTLGSTVDAFAHVFSVSDGKVHWLSDDRSTGIPIFAGRTLKYPTDGSLSVELPGGADRQTEAVWVLAIRRKAAASIGPAILSHLFGGGGDVPIGRVFLALAQFERMDWSQKAVAYEIAR